MKVILWAERQCHVTTEDLGQIEVRNHHLKNIMFSHIHEKAVDETNFERDANNLLQYTDDV